MAIPVWSGPAVAYRGEVYSDGGLIESIPVDDAAGRGRDARDRPALARRRLPQGRAGRLYGVAEDTVVRRLPGRAAAAGPRAPGALRRRGRRAGRGRCGRRSARGAGDADRAARGDAARRTAAGRPRAGPRGDRRPARAPPAQRSSTTMRSPSPTESARRPRSSSSSSVADDLAPPALQRAHVGLVEAQAHGGDDALQVGARGEQLVGDLGRLGARPHERLGERDQAGVVGMGRGRLAALDGDRRQLAAARDLVEDRLAAAADDALVEPADLAQPVEVLRAALGDLDRAPRPGARSGRGGPPRRRRPRATAPARARPRAGPGRAS